VFRGTSQEGEDVCTGGWRNFSDRTWWSSSPNEFRAENPEQAMIHAQFAEHVREITPRFPHFIPIIPMDAAFLCAAHHTSLGIASLPFRSLSIQFP